MVRSGKKRKSKYFKKYGRTIAQMAQITRWSIGTVHAYLQTRAGRKELFAEIKRVLEWGES